MGNKQANPTLPPSTLQAISRGKSASPMAMASAMVEQKLVEVCCTGFVVGVK